MNVSIIITTYNWPEALNPVLVSAISQSVLPYEIIVADDGSKEETANLVQKVLGPSGLNWAHVQHEDSGIRQARVKNLAVRYARGDYLIFIDHDVLLHPDFVKDHLAFAAPGHFLQGKRAFLPEWYTEKLLAGDAAFLPPPFFLNGLENRKNAVHKPWIGRILGRSRRFQTTLRGCNVSMYKRDFFTIDGYDETFDQAWGREDSDLCYRLFHNGINVKNLWFAGLQYHLYHKVIKNRKRDVLDHELAHILRERRKRAIKGFSGMSDEGWIVASSKDFNSAGKGLDLP